MVRIRCSGRAPVLAALLLAACSGAAGQVVVDEERFLEATANIADRPEAGLELAEGVCGLLDFFYADTDDIDSDEEYALEAARRALGSPESVFDTAVGSMREVGLTEAEAHTMMDAVLRYQCGQEHAYRDWARWSR